MPVDLTVVDAFATRPFTGNPAAVCVLDHPAPEPWMQAVAAEMHLSETAFAVTRGDGTFDLRWFTPETEVDLCGHATLATAHLVGDARFDTRSGVLACRVGDDGWVTMDFPADPPAEVPHPPGLEEALGLGGRRAVVATARGSTDLLVEVRDARTVRALAPDLEAVARIDARGVIVTAAADGPGPDFVSRFFAPRVGVPEDPVTGSAHCTLAPWWSARTGRTRLTGLQVSRRGGEVRAAVEGDRVALGGRAVTVAHVRLLVDPG